MIETAALYTGARTPAIDCENFNVAVAVCSAEVSLRLSRTLDVLSRGTMRTPKLPVFVPGRERARAIAAFDTVSNPSALQLKLVGDVADTAVISAAIRHLESRGKNGALFVLDQGAVPEHDWMSASLQALVAGADAVAANAAPRPAPCELPPRELGPRDLALRYGQLVCKFKDELDPDPDDPAPLHADEGGAGVAVTLRALVGAGGMPSVASAPGRHLLARIRMSGGIIRHVPEARVSAPSIRPSIPWLFWPDDQGDLSAVAAGAGEVERALRLRADLRKRLLRHHAGLPPAERARAIRADLALATPFLPVPAGPMPVKRACEQLTDRFRALREEGQQLLRPLLPGLVVDPAAPEPAIVPTIRRSSL